MADCYTELEKAVVVLVENFYKYVSKHSLVKNKISKSSFRKMLQKELNHMLTVRSPRLRALPTHQPPPVLILVWCPSPLRPLSFQSDPLNQRLTTAQAPVLLGCRGLTREVLGLCVAAALRTADHPPPHFLSRIQVTGRLLTSSSRTWTPTTMGASALTSTGP